MNETVSNTGLGRAAFAGAAVGADGITLREYLVLYWRLVGARARSQMQYKLSFALLTLTGIATVLTDFLVVVVLLGRIPHLAGWSLGEIALLFGASTISFRLAEMLASGFDIFHRQIVQGTFDRILTRPLGAFFQVFASELALRRLGPVAQGLLILLVAQQHLAIHWSPDKILVLVLAVLTGIVIFFSIFVMGAASAFWTIQANEAVNIFTNGGFTMLSYPLDIYHNWLRRFVTFVLPLAFINYYPALYVLDRRDPLGLPSWIGLLSPVAAVVFALLAWAVWSVGARHYQSTGS